MLVDGLDGEQRQQVVEKLAELDRKPEPSGEELVEVTKRDGTVVSITAARLAQLRRNAGVDLNLPRKGSEPS